MLFKAIREVMYPDSTYGNDSGGDPDEIPTLTQEVFKAFHEKYYHPSNSMIYLYGNGDIGKHLAFLDVEYLGRFDKTVIDAGIVPQGVFDKPKDVTADYAVDDDDSLVDKTFLSANYLLPPNVDPVLRRGMQLLGHILVDCEDAPLKRALFDAGIGKNVSCHFDSSILQPCFSIVVSSSNPGKKEKFRALLDKTLKELVTEGIGSKLIEEAFNRTGFIRNFMSSGFPKGLELNSRILESWRYGGDALLCLRRGPITDKILDDAPNGYFERLIREHFLENPSHGFVTLLPKQSLEKKRTETLKRKLSRIKTSLSEARLAEIKERTAFFKARQVAPDGTEDVAMIPTLAISDIDRKADEIPFQVNEDFLHTMVETNGIAYITVYFNALQAEPEDAPYVSLLSNLLCRVDTENYSYVDLNGEIGRHTGGMGTSLNTTFAKEGDDFHSYFFINMEVALPKLEKGFDLLLEVLNRSKFDSGARIMEIIRKLRVDMERGFMSSGHDSAQKRAASYFSPLDAYHEKTEGLEYYRFLVDIEKNFDKREKEITEKLRTVAKTVLNGSCGFISVTLSESDFEASRKIFEEFRTKISDKPRVFNRADFKAEQLNEAVVIPSRVQHVVKAADYRKTGFRFSGKMWVLKIILETGYLWNNIRVQGGAYGCGFFVNQAGVFSPWSYRDPHLKRTVDIFEGVADYLENLELTDEELTKAIIATIGQLDPPMPPSEKGFIYAGWHFSGRTLEDIQRERDEVLSTTVADLRAFATMFREGMKQNNICVFGNEQKIKAEKGLFKTIIRAVE